MSAEEALRRLTTGTMIILRGILWAGEWRETLARWILTAIGAAVALTALALHVWLIPVTLLVWMGAANAAAGAEGETEQDSDEDEGEELLDPDDFAELLHEVADGRNVHLTAVRERLIAETGRDWDVLDLCRAHGITTKPVRVAGADPAVTTGVHRYDLPPLPRPLPDAVVDGVSAGHSDNNNTNVTTEPIGQAGMLIKHGPSRRQGVR